MPLKRKASITLDVSPQKRVALSKSNAAGQDTPSRQTRAAKQPVATPTPITTPKVRKTYSKRTEKVQEALQEVANAIPDDTNPVTTPSSNKSRGRKKLTEIQETPSKRPPRHTKASVEPDAEPLETPSRAKRTYTKKLVVEVPPPPSVLAQLPVPPSQSPVFLEPCDPPTTPRKPKTPARIKQPPSEQVSLPTSRHLPSRYYPYLNAQKKAILRTLHAPAALISTGGSNGDEKTAKGLLQDLLQGTVTRSEGNSCLVVGPRGSGKSTILDQCLDALPKPPIVIRLSGWIHHTDRLAMREIAYQLGQQTGESFLQVDENENDTFVEQDENPFFDRPESQSVETGLALPPPSHLPALISVIPTLSRPTVVVLDAFDLFALHPRQALLYCLLDTVQGYRTGTDNKGLAVVGITTRIDTINLLEKRVKSRFSGRVIRTTGMSAVTDILSLAKRALCTPIPSTGDYEELVDGWNDTWSKRISECLEDKEVIDTMKDTVGVMRDPKLLFRILIYAVTRLSPTSPFLSPLIISQAIGSQRSRLPLYDSLDLPYPALCLLISSIHTISSGHDTFTFEMLFAMFRNQLRASMAAPVQVNGGSIGMVRCSKAILLSAFEYLITSRIFVATASSSSSMAKEFSKYRTTLERENVRKVVEKAGQVTLKKWLNKAE